MLNKIRYHHKLLFCLFLSCTITACNSGGSGNNNAPPPVSLEDVQQTATITTHADSTVKKSILNGNLVAFYGTLNGGDSTNNLTESGSVSSSQQVNSNQSWTFDLYTSSNLLVDHLSWDASCPNNTWINPKTGKSALVTANLNCDNHTTIDENGHTHTNGRCYLSGGENNSKELNTPKYSNPTAVFYINETGLNEYHVSCTYTW